MKHSATQTLIVSIHVVAIWAAVSGGVLAAVPTPVEPPPNAPAMDANTGMDVCAIRKARSRPSVISTTRPISQDGVSLLGVHWNAATKTLSGKSAGVGGDPYVMTVHLPQGFRLASTEASGEKAEIANQAEAATVRIVPMATRTIEWKLHLSN